MVVNSARLILFNYLIALIGGGVVHRDFQKMAADALELEFQAVVSHLM